MDQQISCVKWKGSFDGCVTTAMTTASDASDAACGKGSWTVDISWKCGSCYQVTIMGSSLGTVSGVGLAMEHGSLAQLQVASTTPAVTYLLTASEIKKGKVRKLTLQEVIQATDTRQTVSVSFGRLSKC